MTPGSAGPIVSTRSPRCPFAETNGGMGPRPPELANRRRPAQCRYIPGPENPGHRSGSLQEHWTGPVGPGVSARPGSVRATVGVTPDPGPKPARSGAGVGRGRLWRLRSSTRPAVLQGSPHRAGSPGVPAPGRRRAGPAPPRPGAAAGPAEAAATRGAQVAGQAAGPARHD